MGLALSRKAGESIHIGNDIKVTISEVFHGKVRVIIDAPSHVLILRSELLESSDAKPEDDQRATGGETGTP